MTDLLPFTETGEASLTPDQWARRRRLRFMAGVMLAGGKERAEVIKWMWECVDVYWDRHPAEIPECWPVEE